MCVCTRVRVALKSQVFLFFWFKVSMPIAISALRVLLQSFSLAAGPHKGASFPLFVPSGSVPCIGYLKWKHSQSSGRNSSLNFPWPQLSSRQVASPPGKHEKEAFPGLLTSSTQGSKQLHSPAQLLGNQGDQVHSQGPPPTPNILCQDGNTSPTFQALSASWRPQQLLCSGEAGGLSCK